MHRNVKHLAYCRGVEAECREEIRAIEVELAATLLSQRLDRARERLAVALDDVADAVAIVQKKALAVYEEAGDKSPHPAVKIAMFTVLNYAPEAALEYARLHLPKALKLDRRMFERAAKAIEAEALRTLAVGFTDKQNARGQDVRLQLSSGSG